MMEKLSELGARSFTPMYCDRSHEKSQKSIGKYMIKRANRKTRENFKQEDVEEDGNKRYERWSRICIASAKQSRRAYLMDISGAIKLKDFVAEDYRIRTPFHCNASNKSKSEGRSIILIGAQFATPLSDYIESQLLSNSREFKNSNFYILIGPEGELRCFDCHCQMKYSLRHEDV